ncbi:hypothetical protein B0T21DRAFT_408185 [Apiosordaria backusii]|uniref:Uncharacterized protein n=1 Tax=Apiosordaria backusii TaxID=314023 RepID=A0AA40ETF3_9PEZI|nr:hypothetical protein B0T21DRAFT_408185 [Apiosordaria backusii]
MYPDLDGNGRVDMTAVRALTNGAVTWFNDCPGAGGGDDPNTHTTRAQLPAPPVDDDIAAFLAARAWQMEGGNWQYGEMGEPEINDKARRIEWHPSCNELDNKMLKTYISGSFQGMWGITDEIHNEIFVRGRGDLNFYSNAAQEYWGPPNLVQNKASIRSALLRANQMFGRDPPISYRVKVHCDDWYYDNQQEINPGDICDGRTWAYVKTGEEVETVTFCWNKFKPGREAAGTLAAANEQARNKGHLNMDNWEWLGMTWYHEIFHLSSVGYDSIQEHISDLDIVFDDGQRIPAYQAHAAKLLGQWVSSAGRTVSHLNADNYAYYAMALVAQNRYPDGTYPYQPVLSGRLPKTVHDRNDPDPIASHYYWKRPKLPNKHGEKPLVVEVSYDSFASREDYTPEYIAAHDAWLAEAAAAKRKKL